jgi:hypothetical protein
VSGKNVALLCCFPIDRPFAFLYGDRITFVCAELTVFDPARHSDHSSDGISKINTRHVNTKKHGGVNICIFKRGTEERG